MGISNVERKRRNKAVNIWTNIWSAEKAYILGFFLADGNIEEGNRVRFTNNEKEH